MWYESLHITSFNVFGLQIQVWGLMLAIGVLTGWFWFDYLMKKNKNSFDSSWLVLGVVIFGLLGARILQVIVDFEYYRQNLWEIIKIWQGGLTSYGAMIGIFLWLVFYVHYFYKNNRNLFWDAAFMSMMLSLAVARIGCFLINDHIGNVSNVPWAIMVAGELRHPIALYYVINAFMIFVILYVLFIKKRLSGKLAGVAMICYAVTRSMIDLFFKDFDGDNTRIWLTFILGGVLGCLALVILFWPRRNSYAN